MYSHTKKVGLMGKYGPRVGRKSREEARKIYEESYRSRTCISCGKGRVKRNASGIWQCRTCGVLFAGGAFVPLPKKEAIETEV